MNLHSLSGMVSHDLVDLGYQDGLSGDGWTAAMRVVGIGASVALAWLAFRFVEGPSLDRVRRV